MASTIRQTVNFFQPLHPVSFHVLSERQEDSQSLELLFAQLYGHLSRLLARSALHLRITAVAIFLLHDCDNVEVVE